MNYWKFAKPVLSKQKTLVLIKGGQNARIERFSLFFNPNCSLPFDFCVGFGYVRLDVYQGRIQGSHK
jgi:hypothetical protein